MSFCFWFFSRNSRKQSRFREDLISKALIDSNISEHEFVSTDIVLKEYDEMKEETKIQILLNESLLY